MWCGMVWCGVAQIWCMQAQIERHNFQQEIHRLLAKVILLCVHMSKGEFLGLAHAAMFTPYLAPPIKLSRSFTQSCTVFCGHALRLVFLKIHLASI